MAAVNKGICAVVSAGKITDYTFLYENCSKCDYVICADAGYLHVRKAGIRADAIVGDFDSGIAVQGDNVTVYPVRKDDTDTALAVALGVEKGYRRINVFGACSGNRLDHTMAAVVLCCKYAPQGVDIHLFDEKNEIYALCPGTYTFEKDDRKLSFFAFGSDVRDLCEAGVSYPLENYYLSTDNPLCVSNEITDSVATVSFKSGMLVVFRSQD